MHFSTSSIVSSGPFQKNTERNWIYEFSEKF